MSPRFWIEISNKKKVVCFAAAMALLALFWFLLPTESKTIVFLHHPRGLITPSELMIIGWVGGWFLLLFVRAEDLNVLAPIDYQNMCRVVAWIMIIAALSVAGGYSFTFLR